MHGLLYINDERIGQANLKLAFGQDRTIQLTINTFGHASEYAVSEGDVYVNGPRLGVRGYVAATENCHTARRPVMMTFEFIPVKQSLASAAKKFAARFVYRSRWGMPTDQTSVPRGPRRLNTETATQ